MIETNELMAGDWVYMEANRGYEAQYIQVETIPDASSKDRYGHIGAFPVGGDNDFRDIEDRHLFPIPLTPDILENNGFERSEVFVEWKYENDNVYMIYKPFPYLKIQTEEHIVAFPCEYVHQLQHALRLCGIEKEIEL